jgi:prepilin-type N-terminal cleavage/methylation domain-containing protein
MAQPLGGAGQAVRFAVTNIQMKKTKKAFTLIELLVVITIVAILAAMLLPALNRAKWAADSVGCHSNLRQLTMGLGMYAQDLGTYPLMHSFPAQLQPFSRAAFPSDNYQRVGASWAYLGPRQSIYACPAFNRLQGELAHTIPIITYGETSVSYGYNCGGTTAHLACHERYWEGQGLGGRGSAEWTTGVTPTRESQVVCPSDMLALGDAALTIWQDQGVVGGDEELEIPFVYWNFFDAVRFGNPNASQAVKAMQQRHRARWNTSFCDGHTESLKVRTLFELRDPLVARRWNNDHQPHNEQWEPPP